MLQRRHGDSTKVGLSVWPVGSDGLDLSIELNSLLAIKVQVPTDGGPASSEGEHGQWDGNRYIDANLSDIHFVLELSSGGTRLCEHGTSITVWILFHAGSMMVSNVSASILDRPR